MNYHYIALADAPPELASAPFQTHSRLTQIAMVEKPKGFIADEVLPRVDSPFSFKYTKGENVDQFSIPDTRASRAGRLSEVEFGAVLADGSTDDHGLIVFVPQRDILEAQRQQSAWDPLAQAAMGAVQLMELAREKRVVDVVFADGSYPTGYKTTLSGNSQWSDHTSSNPLTTILEALDIPITRPNTLVLGQAVWTKLRDPSEDRRGDQDDRRGRHERGRGRGAPGGGRSVRARPGALVGETWNQTATRGQTEVYARLWGKHAAALHIRRPASTRDAMPTWGFTAQAMAREVALSEEPSRGIGRGSRAIKVSESVGEMVSWDTAGYFWQNAVA